MVCGFLLQILLRDFLAGNVKFLFLYFFALATIFGRKKAQAKPILGNDSMKLQETVSSM